MIRFNGYCKNKASFPRLALSALEGMMKIMKKKCLLRKGIALLLTAAMITRGGGIVLIAHCKRYRQQKRYIQRRIKGKRKERPASRRKQILQVPLKRTSQKMVIQKTAQYKCQNQTNQNWNPQQIQKKQGKVKPQRKIIQNLVQKRKLTQILPMKQKLT